MKPLGVTADLRVRMPSRAEDMIWEAVREAINDGMTPEQFKSEAAEAWQECLKEDGKHAAKTLSGRNA